MPRLDFAYAGIKFKSSYFNMVLKGDYKNMINNERLSGILLHPTSLPSPYGIGDLGDEAYAFIDFLARAGQHLWQVLPLTHRFRRLSVPEFFCFCRSASSHWSKTFDPSWTDRWLGTYRLPDCRPKSRRLWAGHSVEGESSGPCLQPFSTETPWNPRHGPVFPGILWKQPLLAGWLCFVYGM